MSLRFAGSALPIPSVKMNGISAVRCQLDARARITKLVEVCFGVFSHELTSFVESSHVGQVDK